MDNEDHHRSQQILISKQDSHRRYSVHGLSQHFVSAGNRQANTTDNNNRMENTPVLPVVLQFSSTAYDSLPIRLDYCTGRLKLIR